MTVDVRPSVLVRRPPNEVAAFMFDPSNDLRWTGYVVTHHKPDRLVELKSTGHSP